MEKKRRMMEISIRGEMTVQFEVTDITFNCQTEDN